MQDHVNLSRGFWYDSGLFTSDTKPDLMLLTFIALAASILACSGQDPILDRAAEMQEGVSRVQTEPASAGTIPGAPSTTGSGAPSQGAAVPPKPGDPAAPSPGVPGQPAPGRPDQPSPGVPGSAGPTVTLTGTVQVDGWGGGPIRVDIFDGNQQAAAGSSKRPSVVAQANLDGPGAFEVRVPASAGQLWIGAFADEDRNGRPGPRDPSGWFGGNPVSVDGDQGGIVLRLQAAPPPAGGVEME